MSNNKLIRKVNNIDKMCNGGFESILSPKYSSEHEKKDTCAIISWYMYVHAHVFVFS